MIISQITAGLGNQMFQYALGIHLSKLHNTTLYLDIDSYQWDTLRKFELQNVFGITNKISDKSIKETCKSHYKYPVPLRIKRKIKGTEFPYYLQPVFKEQSFDYDSNVFKVLNNTYVSGYFQSECYFKNLSKEIREAFQFSVAPNLYYKSIIKEIKLLESVAIHVRRGDYIKNRETNDFHGTCSISYYNDAISLINQEVKKPTFVFVSDDIEWVKTTFKYVKNALFIENNQGEAYEDMRIMSLCNHNIIANSTFSWWGAWLNNSQNKIVIAPKRWFADNEMQKQTSSLYPKTWLTI